MRQLACVAIVGAVLTVLARCPVGAQDQDKAPSIKEVMDKLHKGANAPLVTLRKELQSNPPPWETIQKTTKDFVILGAALAKNEPPKGDKQNWERLANQYYADAKAMDDAAQKQDKAGTLAARGRLTGSCTACHKAHRGR